MVKIEFTPKQVEELKNHYILELDKLHQRSAEIMGILSKLAHEPVFVEKATEVSAPPPEKKEKEAKPVELPEIKIKRRGRPTDNPNWSNFIPQLLKDQDKPLTKEQILKSYQKQYNVNLTGSKSAMMSLNQAIQRLRVRYNVITSSRRKGKKGNLYSLVTAEVPQEKKPKGKVKAEPKPKAEAKPKAEPKPIPQVQETVDKKLPANTKYNWPLFIGETLTKAKRVLSLKDFVNHALVQYNDQLEDKKATYGKISPVLTQMAKNKDKIRTVRKEGTSRKFYGLTDWFNSNGELITTYK